MNLDRIIAVRTSKTLYRDGDKCIKVFDSGYSKADVLNEAQNHARVEETGLNVPGLLEVTTIDGKWAIVTEYIKGKDLGRLMEEHPEKTEEYLEMLVDLQLAAQVKRNLMLTRLSDKMESEIERCELEATTRVDLRARLLAMPRHNKLCHGDFDPSNILITGDGTPYILDWSHATRGSGAADAALTYLLFRLKGEDENAERYLDLFCMKTGRREEYGEYVQQWLPLVAAAHSIEGNTREREFLLSQVTD